jgi:NitT/TauT family transport system substrate-binding protein
MLTMLHRLGLLGKIGLAAALAAGFAPAGPLIAQALAPVTIGIVNTATDVAFFIADKKGYFREAGLSVTMTPFSSAARMIAPLGTGQLDVGGGTVSAGLYNAVERGIRIRIVADKGSVEEGYEFSTLLVRKDLVESGRYKTLSSLRGLTIAVAAQGSGSESSLNEALKKGGLNFADVKVVYMGFPEQIAAFRNKGIDAGVTNEPTITRAIREGYAVRASDQPIYPGQQTAVLFYSEGFAARRGLAQQFMTAYIRGVREYNAALKEGRLAGPNAAEIISILNASTEIKDPQTYATMTPFAVNPDGHVNAASLKNDLAFFKERALVDGKVSVEQVIDPSFAAEAVRALGPYRGSR